MISNGTATYSYDGENRLATAGGYTYTYDGDGRRVKRQSGLLGIVSWPDLSGRTLDESGLTGTMVREYVFFNGQRVARRDAANNAVHYFFSDHLGSTSLVTNATGTMAACAGYVSGEQETDYYPYGGEYPPFCSTIADQKFKFTGKERDAESGLDYFGARYYGSALGRFLTPDWAARPTTVPYASLGDPQTLNLYGYVENAPLNRVDGDGHGDGNCAAGAALNGQGNGCTQAAEQNRSNAANAAQNNQINTRPPTPAPPANALQKTAFKTSHAAEVEAEKRTNPTSIKENKEYAGWIIKNADGSYSIGKANRGTETGSDPGPKPPNAAEEYHTHGGKTSCTACDENFSPRDKYSLRVTWKVPGVLGTPSGAIKRYDPASGKTTTFEERTDE